MRAAVIPASAGSGGPAGLELWARPRWLIARFATEHTTASWAITGGGLGRARAVAWHQVHDAELPPGVDPAALLRDRLAAIGCAGAIGLLTTRRLDRHVDVKASSGGVTARCIATVGLGNALRAGDPPGSRPAAVTGARGAIERERHDRGGIGVADRRRRSAGIGGIGRIGGIGGIGRIGTINLLVQLDAALSTEAQLEALALAAEARALAVREADIASTRTGQPASGTGTDCIVIAAPATGRPAPYAGKHTAIGHAIGAAVLEATRRGARDWLSEHDRRWLAAPGAMTAEAESTGDRRGAGEVER